MQKIKNKKKKKKNPLKTTPSFSDFLKFKQTQNLNFDCDANTIIFKTHITLWE